MYRVSMRIRGTKQELEDAGEDTEGMVESTSKLREMVQGLTGFDIMADKAGTQFKDVYDIVVGIGEKWKDLTDVEQAGLLETLAGKRQGNYLAAAFGNIDTIKSAYQTAENSQGSADREFAEVQKSVQYSIDKFKASFQELSTNVISSDLLKGMVDFGTIGIESINGVSDALGGLGSIAAGVGITSAIKNFS